MSGYARVVPILCIASVVGLSSACTSSASTTPTPSHASSTPTVTGTAPTAPESSSAPTCLASATELTYGRHRVVLAGGQYDLPPGSAVKTASGLAQTETVVVSDAPGLSADAGLVERLHAHWHAFVNPLGSTSTQLLKGSTVTVQNKHGKKNLEDVVYKTADVYTGTYTASCGGRVRNGTYRAIGEVDTVVLTCGEHYRDGLDRREQHAFC